MMKKTSPSLIAPFLFYLLSAASAHATALDDYVAAPDPAFSFQIIGDPAYDSSTFTRAYTIRLTSQTWRDASQVDHVLWRHWVSVIVPEWDIFLGATKHTALIVIGDGHNDDPAPAIEPDYRAIAAATRSVLVAITNIPNQPLTFTDEVVPREEDEIIAYSWDKFLRGGDSYWPVQLPMVKSVVRCMDTVQQLITNEYASSKRIDNFVIAGASKRGWTAWLTAAVDNRVVAISPIVSDLLNLKPSFAHHWSVYGFWADALAPYEDMGIFDWFATPQIDQLLAIVDPYEYRDRLDIPKYIINAAGDDFFVSDSVRFYINDVPGETHLRHVPNADHYFTNLYEDVFSGMVPYYHAFLNNIARPSFSWTIQPDGTIGVQTNDSPIEVNLWQASNPLARDFRLVTTGPVWTSSPLTDQGGGLYVASVPTPQTGWTAYFLELVFASPFSQAFPQYSGFDYHFTTQMHVLPESRPFEGDFNRDRLTNISDLAVMSASWLTDNPYYDIAPQRRGDGIIDLADLTVFSSHWLKTP